MHHYEEELETLIKAGAKLIEIVSFEIGRVYGFVNDVATNLNIKWYSWSCVSGLKIWENNKLKTIISDYLTLPEVLAFYERQQQGIILVIEDFHSFLNSNNPLNVRLLRETIRIDHPNKAIILSTPFKCIPNELSKELPLIEVDLPDIDTLEIIANHVINQYKDLCLDKNVTHKLLQSALGLTIMEARLAFAKAIITNRKLTEDEIGLIIQQKEQIIRNSGLLEYFHPTEYLSNVGGLNNLKSWINSRSNAFDQKAKAFGLNVPKGLLLLGIPGCGKSLTAKAIANEWKFPLLRFDLGKVYGGIVGESERNIRYALEVAKTISPCILWIDEIEKGISGVQSSGKSDAGTSARVFGTLLTWMQEKKESVFVIATANDVSALPPELLRKGRFDEIFFVDLPSNQERKNIFSIHLKNKNRNPSKYDLELLANLTQDFSGADIEQIVSEALFNAYANKQQDLEMKNLIDCIKNTTPLAITMHENIEQLRQWAKHRARLANDEK